MLKIEAPAASNHWRRHRSTAAACHVLRLLQSNSPTDWFQPLPVSLAAVPAGLSLFLQSLATHGGAAAAARILDDREIQPAEGVRHFISGSNEICHRTHDRETQLFLSSLFHLIQVYSPSAVKICSWDLYHGHLFAYFNEGSDGTLSCDLGIVFHAKEFPKEYRPTRLSEHLPIGHIDRGGEKDPRIGTECSVEDADYSLRNYIWLMSTNRLYVAHPRSPGFPADLIETAEFWTLSTSAFDTASPGDINYLPFTKARFSQLVLPASHTMQADALLHWIAQHKLDKHLTLSLRHARSAAFVIGRLMADATTVVKQCCPDSLRQFIDLLSGEHGCSALRARIPEPVRPYFLSLAQSQLSSIDSKARELWNRHTKIMLDAGFEPQHVDFALRKTRAQETSTLRAENLLQCMYAKYRPASWTSQWWWTPADFTYSEIKNFFFASFYADSALEARALSRRDGLPVTEACGLVISRKTADTERNWELQAAQRALRSANAALSEFTSAHSLRDRDLDPAGDDPSGDHPAGETRASLEAAVAAAETRVVECETAIARAHAEYLAANPRLSSTTTTTSAAVSSSSCC